MPLPASLRQEEDVVAVVAGWGHSALVTAAGHVYTAGRNVQGQLGLGPLEGFPVNERGHRCDPYICALSLFETAIWILTL